MSRSRPGAATLLALALVLGAACVPPVSERPPLAADGEPCDADAACASGQCVAFRDGARCGRRCGDDRDCDPTSACHLAPIEGAATTEIERICETASATVATAGTACAHDGECRSRLCEAGECLELCTDQCGPGRRCEARAIERFSSSISTDVCAVRLAAADLDLGPVETTLDGSLELSFDVPEGTGAFTVVLDDPEGLRVAVRTLIAPDGTALVDGDPATIDLNPGSSYIGTAALMVPSTDRPEARAAPGRWRLRVGTYEAARFDALIPVSGRVEHVWLHFEPRLELGGRLDLVLHFAPGTGVDIEAPIDEGVLQPLREALRALLLEPAALTLGELELRALAPEHDRVEDGDETREICRQRSELGPNGASVNIFVVERLDYTSGHSGGIPGPPGLAHTRASGIVLQHLGDWGDTGILLSHEVGHFLGLRHTSELTGGERDPITDTEECPPGTEISSCPDFRNLMFPNFPLANDLELTPGQVAVLRGSPFLYEGH